jgi:hypothetical protein
MITRACELPDAPRLQSHPPRVPHSLDQKSSGPCPGYVMKTIPEDGKTTGLFDTAASKKISELTSGT